MRLLKKIAALSLAAAMCFGTLAGCKKEDPPIAPKDYIYKLTEFSSAGEDYGYINGFDFGGDSVYLLTSLSETINDEATTNNYLYKTDNSGAVKEKLLLSSETERQILTNDYMTFYSGLSVGSDGSVYLWRQKSGSFPDADGVKKQGIKAEIVKADGENQTVLLDVGEKLTSLGVDMSTLYIYGFTVDDKNIAYVSVNMDSVWAFDLTTGNVVLENKPIPGGVGDYGGMIKGFYNNADGSTSVVSYGSIEENGDLVDKLIITPINTQMGAYGTSVSIDAPGDMQSNISQGDAKYDYYGYGLSSIYGYKDGVRTLVADLPASGANLNQIQTMIPISETEFLLMGTTPEEVINAKLFKLTKVDPKDVPDRTIITVAAIVDELYLSGYITEFTVAHPQYQVEYKIYADDENTSFEDALEAFNTDIIAGNVPDVLLIDPSMPYGNYVNKGLFADLYKFIDNDPEVSREIYYEAFLKALETDGKLYSIAPAFQMHTLVGKTSIFGDKSGQSLAELEAAAAKIPGATLFGNIDREYFVGGVFTRASRQFIDYEKGVATFDSPEFISLLEYAKSLPAPAADAEPYISSTWFPDETGDYKEDRVLTEFLGMVDFRDVVSMEKLDFGEPITFLGFPNASGGSGITARARLETAVMAKAKNPDGAWAFVKGLQYYGDPFVESCGYPPLWFFPLLVSELETAAKNSTETAYQYDFVTGERVDRYQWLGADLSIQPNNTEADNAKVYAMFDQIDGIRRTVPAIDNIISEETQAYLAGDRSAEETAKIIQNRATTYLEEMK
ncbi:MAG: extracellular solute-binding protein [Ruminococcus sp.]|jgi:ABC-type glycerol-3-phosphate transport system substrate-binding protein|nr:extracellular solute-binding protein [Ruminococcus sp.]